HKLRMLKLIVFKIFISIFSPLYLICLECNLLDLSYLINKDRNVSFDLTHVLPKGYVTDGSIDYTHFIQIGLDNYRDIIMPNFPVRVSGIFPRSNTKIFFQEKSKLILSPTSRERYQIIGLHGVKNVVIH